MKKILCFILFLSLISCSKGDTEKTYRVQAINFVNDEPLPQLILCFSNTYPKECQTTDGQGIAHFAFDANSVLQGFTQNFTIENNSREYFMPKLSLPLNNPDHIVETYLYPWLYLHTFIDTTIEFTQILLTGRPIQNGNISTTDILVEYIFPDNPSSKKPVNYFSILLGGMLDYVYSVDSVELNFLIRKETGSSEINFKDTINLTFSETTSYHLKL